VVEGILTVVVVNLLAQYSRDELSALAFLRGAK
jgi:cobalt/nickel transport system permease protein